MLDKQYDNDNNSYMKFKMFIYHTIDGVVETINVPWVPCDGPPEIPQNVKDIDYPGKYYCPDYGENDKLLNNYYYADSAWMRWTIERCNDNDTQVTCNSTENIDNYAREHIVVLQARFGYMNLLNTTHPIKWSIENLLYSSAQSNIKTKG